MKGYNGLSTFDYPIIADPTRELANQFGMIDAKLGMSGMPVTCRAVFIFGPDKKMKLQILYPASTGRNFAEVLLQFSALCRPDIWTVFSAPMWPRLLIFCSRFCAWLIPSNSQPTSASPPQPTGLRASPAWSYHRFPTRLQLKNSPKDSRRRRFLPARDTFASRPSPICETGRFRAVLVDFAAMPCADCAVPANVSFRSRVNANLRMVVAFDV